MQQRIGAASKERLGEVRRCSRGVPRRFEVSHGKERAGWKGQDRCDAEMLGGAR